MVRDGFFEEGFGGRSKRVIRNTRVEIRLSLRNKKRKVSSEVYV